MSTKKAIRVNGSSDPVVPDRIAEFIQKAEGEGKRLSPQGKKVLIDLNNLVEEIENGEHLRRVRLYSQGVGVPSSATLNWMVEMGKEAIYMTLSKNGVMENVLDDVLRIISTMLDLKAIEAQELMRQRSKSRIPYDGNQIYVTFNWLPDYLDHVRMMQ